MIHQFATRVTPITNHQFYIQAALILAVIAVGWMMLRTPGGARHMAARRLVTLAFVAFAVFNITFPWVMSSIAHRMGVGRGTDFLLYALVIAFLAQILSSFRRLVVNRIVEKHLKGIRDIPSLFGTAFPLQDAKIHLQDPLILQDRNISSLQDDLCGLPRPPKGTGKADVEGNVP